MREDQLIWRGVQQIGCKWRQIAAMLPGRSDDAVRNRYNRLKEAEASGLVRSDSGEPTEAHATGTVSGGGGGGGGGTGTYRCSKCGQLKKNHVCTAIATGDARPKSDDKRRPERVGWTKAEDVIVTQSVQELGQRWFQIAERPCPDAPIMRSATGGTACSRCDRRRSSGPSRAAQRRATRRTRRRRPTRPKAAATT